MTAMKVHGLEIKDLVIHRVPEPGVGRGPILSEVSDPQTPAVRAYFEDRLQKVMADRGFDIERDTDLDAVATDCVSEALRDPARLVPASQSLAKRLYEVQDRRSPEGILVVALCQLGERAAVGLLKLEHEKGVQAEEEREGGKLVFRVVLHEDLMLTRKTAVFKAAVFQFDSGDSPQLQAVASDLQVERRLADFFLTDFLGCRLIENPAVRTEHFFEVTESFIRTVEDPERKARYEMGLLTLMHSQARKTVDPVAFAEETMDTDDQQPFYEHLRQEEVAEQRFPKDTAEIKGRIKRMAFDFESGIKVMGKPEAIDEHVTVGSERDDGKVEVIVADRLTTVHGRG
jgi:hypothetical protein